jgi:hypothetical protein
MNESRIATIIEQIDPPLSETRVVCHYGGIGLLFCAMGRHDQWFVEDEAAGRARTQVVCLRCGRTLAIVDSEWEEEE